MIYEHKPYFMEIKLPIKIDDSRIINGQTYLLGLIVLEDFIYKTATANTEVSRFIMGRRRNGISFNDEDIRKVYLLKSIPECLGNPNEWK